MVGVHWSHKNWKVAGAITRRHGIEICCLRFKKKEINKGNEKEGNKKNYSMGLFSGCWVFFYYW